MSAEVPQTESESETPRFKSNCPNCGMTEQVRYGDEFECNGCGRTDLSLDLRDVVQEGEYVRVHIENTAPLGGDTQFEGFEVEDRTWDEFSGTDENWGDTITVERDGKTLQLQSGGMAGEVVRIERLSLSDSGVPVLPPEKTVYQV